MTYSYTLSWDEFLEMYQPTLPRPSVASFVATIFIACAVGVFGAVLTYAVDLESKMTASIFCWLSLALFLTAFWDLRVRSAKQKVQAINNLRATYKSYFSSEQSFEFADEKWTLETESEKQEVWWSSLSTAVEWPRVLALLRRGQPTVAVPKRVLSAEDLKNLRRLAIVVGGEKVWSSKVSLADFILTEISSLWRKHTFLMTAAHAGGLFFSGMVANAMYDKTGPGTPFGWTLAGLVFFLTISAQFWYFFIKYLTSHKECGMPCVVGFSEKGMQTVRADVEFFHSWGAFISFREASRCFLLYFNASDYYLVPKNCIPPEHKPHLRDLVRSKLA